MWLHVKFLKSNLSPTVSLVWQTFRETNVFIVEEITKALISRNISDHEITSHCTVWKNEKTLTQNFFRQINYLVILLVKSLFSRNFCQKRVRVNFCNFHTVLYEFKNISWNQMLSNFLSYNVTFAKLLSKSVRVNFCNFHTVWSVSLLYSLLYPSW